MNLFERPARPFGPDESISELICQGLPLLRRPTERQKKLKGPTLPPVDLMKTRRKPGEPQQQLPSLELVNRGRQVRKVENLRPSAPSVGISRLDTRISVPLLSRLQPSRPLQPPNVSTRRRVCPWMNLNRCATDSKLTGPILPPTVDRKRDREPERKLTGLNLVIRGRSVQKVQFEPLRPSVPPAKPQSVDTHRGQAPPTRVALPVLGRLQPSRPLQAYPVMSTIKRTQHSDKDHGFYVRNTPGFPILAPK